MNKEETERGNGEFNFKDYIWRLEEGYGRLKELSKEVGGLKRMSIVTIMLYTENREGKEGEVKRILCEESANSAVVSIECITVEELIEKCKEKGFRKVVKQPGKDEVCIDMASIDYE